MPRIVLKQKYRGKKDASVVVSSGRKIVVKKKFRKQPKMNIRKLAYAINRINSEKKDSGFYSGDNPVGQITVSAGGLITSGHYGATSFVCTPSNGTGENQRIGDTISLTGMYNEFQFRQQPNATAAIKLKIIFACPRWTGSQSSGFTGQGMAELLNPNPFITGYAGSSALVYDYMSSRNQDYMKNWKVLRTMVVKLPQDTASSQKTIKTVRCGLKFKTPHKVQYNDAGVIVEGDIRMFIVADCGNNSSNVPSGSGQGTTTGIAVTDTLSGAIVSWYSKSYYMDN